MFSNVFIWLNKQSASFKRFKISAFLCITLSVVVFTKVQAQTYPFTNFTVENGLSQGQVLCVFQDEEGVMWFGTNGGGITKYDGKNFEYIKDKDGLIDNTVFCITKHPNGSLLIGTNGGLSVYNPKLKKEYRFKNYTTANGLSHNRIFTIKINNQGSILLGTGMGVSVFKEGVCSLLKLNNALDSSSVFHMMEDTQHQLWCSTLGNGVFCYDGKNTTHYSSKDGLQNNMVFSTFEYQPNVYWLCTGEGLFELKNQRLKHINPANIDTTTTYFSCLRDNKNSIWIGTGKGIIKYNTNKSITLLDSKNGLVDNNIWKVFQDKEHNLWFASNEKGISKLISEHFLGYSNTKLLNPDVKAICQTKHGIFWIGYDNGLTENSNNMINHYTKDNIIGNLKVLKIKEDRIGNILIGTGNGLLVFDGKNFKRIISQIEGEDLNVIYDIFINSNEEVWLGTQAGVAKIVNGHIEAIDDLSSIKSTINEIYEDSKGTFWLSTTNGLYNFNGITVTHFTEKHGIPQIPIYSIEEDYDQNLWIASNVGIYKYSQGHFSLISDKQGLASNNVYSLIIDKRGFLWAGLPNGLDRISIENGNYKIKHYNTFDGFIGGECNQNAMIADKDGKLWIGTSNGLVVYQPEYDRDNTLEPFTKLKRIDLFNQATNWMEYADSVAVNNIPHNLTLPYTNNYLTFSFVGVSLTTPEKVRYQYMLKGIDKDWRYGPETEAAYQNIPPGKYEFLVKAENGEGVKNKEFVSFKFVISPPWWRTWWAYSILAFIVMSGVYSYIKIRTANNKILKQNSIIEEKNSALNLANTEIAEKNQSITDSINYAKRIQESFLTSSDVINKKVPGHFTLYKPRDIVSGDFYWAFDLPDRILIACSDCTGHGIPGAFMSLIGISLLNEISHSKGIIEPADILNELRRIIICALNPEQIESGGKDGMDISLISIFKPTDTNEIKIHFSGANNSLHLVSTKNNTSELLEFKGDKQPVGFYSNMKPFSQQEIIAQKGDTIYMYTDGYADQFGGTKGKKFMSKQLKQLLFSISQLPLQEQKIHLEKTFVEWQGTLEQVDDVTVMGIKL